MTELRRLSRASCAEFLDFAGTQRSGAPVLEHWTRLAGSQLDGAVALYNRLVDGRVAWLADEVGLGKTFVALGVAALLRHEKPEARILFLLPTSRLQPQWERVIQLFSRTVVQQIDHRARTCQGLPCRPSVSPTRLGDLAWDMVADPDRDVLASLSAFSFGLGANERDNWSKHWRRLTQLSPHLPRRLPAWCYQRKRTFKDVYAAALNLLLPDFDLVICDESHNLRAGAGHSAARNRSIAAALGGIVGEDIRDHLPWDAPPTPRVRRLLCLTATPVEHGFAEMGRQAEVFGFRPGRDDLPQPTRDDLGALLGHDALADEDAEAERQKAAARRLTIRRLHELHGHGEQGLTKNLYRREWRHGGLEEHDEPMHLASDRERLVVALVQRRVLEVLHRSGGADAQRASMPSFQMGLLSSFESFHQTLENRRRRADERATEAEQDADTPAFEGTDEQTRDAREREGLDTASVDALCESYRAAFGSAPPHPKMDQTAAQLAEWGQRGDKSLVFVRRVKTTEELADKVAHALSLRLIERVGREVPEGLRAQWQAMVTEWNVARRHEDTRKQRPVDDGRNHDDEGSAVTFFSWFCWGSGDTAHHKVHGTAAALRKQCLNDTKHPWSTLLYDNHVLWLLELAEEPVEAWVEARRDALTEQARRWLDPKKEATHRALFEAWQAAGLEILSKEHEGTALGATAAWVQRNLFGSPGPCVDLDPGEPLKWLRTWTFFSALRGHDLVKELWPTGFEAQDPRTLEGERKLRRREIQREVLAAPLRLGQAQLDLWLTGIRTAGAMEIPGSKAVPLTEALCRALLARLDAQRRAAEAGEPVMNAWWELSHLGDDAIFDRVVDVNFPKIYKVDLDGLRTFLASQLGRQSPAVAVRGGLKSERVERQFRMPGYPLVIVSTEVLAEGVDLHTFCGRVVHYGISHSSSGTEQRTGRVDRIGSLVHRRLQPSDEESKLQVHYPHLADTIEPVQVARLYRRMNRFLEMVHDNLMLPGAEDTRATLDLSGAGLLNYPPPPSERLESAFQVREDDLKGESLSPTPSEALKEQAALRDAVAALFEQRGVAVTELDGEIAWRGEAWLGPKGELVGNSAPDAPPGTWRRQPFEASLRTRRDGRGFLFRVDSPVGAVALLDGRTAGAWLRRQKSLVGARLVSLQQKRGTRLVGVRSEVPLAGGPGATGAVEAAFSVALRQADALEHELLDGQDLSLHQWKETR